MMMKRFLLALALGMAVVAAQAQATDNKEWSGKKWSVLGDSLTERNSRTTKSYHDYISEFTGITVQNCGLSGSGYMRLHQDGRAFFQRVGSIDPSADAITVFGSGNDLNYKKLGDYNSFEEVLGKVTDTDTTTICGCINRTLTEIQRQFPLTPLGVITPTPWIGSEPTDSGNNMEKYAEALVEICHMRGVPCLDLYHCSNLHPSSESFRQAAYSKDDGNGVHPDETGHRIIAPRVKQFLESLITF